MPQERQRFDFGDRAKLEPLHWEKNLFGGLARYFHTIVALRYLEEGVVTYEPQELYKCFRIRHPEDEGTVGSLYELESPTARFTLLRMVLDDLRRVMTDSRSCKQPQ